MRFHLYHKLLLGAFVVVAGFVILFRSINRSIDRQISSQVEKIREDLAKQEKVQPPVLAPKREKRELTASDISALTISEQRKSDLFKNQQYWDIETRKALTHDDAIGQIKSGALFTGEMLSSEQLDRQIDRIEDRIRAYKQQVRENPYDEYSKQKLQDLYMMKSTVRILGENLEKDGRH